MQRIHVSDQYAANSLSESVALADTDIPVIETALQHANMKTLAVRTSSGQGVALTESQVTGLLVLRTRAEHAALASALNSVVGLDLPGVLMANSSGIESAAACVRWVAPDEWMLSCPLEEAFDIENNLRKAMGDVSIAIVNVSGGYTVLKLQGNHANDVLKKSTGYDVHPSNFVPGKVVNTVFAKAQVTMRCVDTTHYEIIVRRSFADYLWHWLQVASAEYGLSIEVD